MLVLWKTSGAVQGEGVDLAMSGPLCSPEIPSGARKNDDARKKRHPLHHAAMCAIQKVRCVSERYRRELNGLQVAAMQRESQLVNITSKRKTLLQQVDSSDGSREETADTAVKHAPLLEMPPHAMYSRRTWSTKARTSALASTST